MEYWVLKIGLGLFFKLKLSCIPIEETQLSNIPKRRNHYAASIENILP
jgi:hypothetical protein